MSSNAIPHHLPSKPLHIVFIVAQPYAKVMVHHADIYKTLSQALATPQVTPSSRRAAVAIVLRDPPATSDTNTETHSEIASILPQVLLIQRAPNPNDRWSAHIAFPGGRQDESDECDLQTAIREAREELGLCLDDARTYSLVGRLNDRPINRNGSYVLSAFVFRQLPPWSEPLQSGNSTTMTPSMTSQQLQHNEVSSAFWVSLENLHQQSPTSTYHTYYRHRPAGTSHSFTTVKYILLRWVGLDVLRMPAVDVLRDSIAVGRVFAKNQHILAPHVVLWGLTLGCVGDVIEAIQLRRVDWPRVLPNGKLLGGSVWLIAEIWYILLQGFTRLTRLLK